MVGSTSTRNGLKRTKSDQSRGNGIQSHCSKSERSYTSNYYKNLERRSCDPSDLKLSVISTYVHGKETLVELLGPSSDMKKSCAAIMLTAPHGGTLRPDYIPNRQTQGPYCTNINNNSNSNTKTRKTCLTLNDTFTKDITLSIANQIIKNYCKVPFVIINHLHRSKLDANRDVYEGAQENTIAREAWWKYHTFIQNAQSMIMGTHGVVDNAVGQYGIKGLLLDVHGYAGYDWVPLHVHNYTNYTYLHNDHRYVNKDESIRLGSPFIQWGYGLSRESLDLNYNHDLDTVTRVNDGSTFSHGQFLPNQSLEGLVRGPNSIGSRLVSSMKDDEQWNIHNDTSKMCGMGLPSHEYPNPNQLSTDTSYCHNVPCPYFTGGYNVNAHKHYTDWKSRKNSSLIMNTVQMELPRCIRFGLEDGTFFGGRDEVHKRFAHHLSVSVCAFLRDVFQDEDLC